VQLVKFARVHAGRTGNLVDLGGNLARVFRDVKAGHPLDARTADQQVVGNDRIVMA
jgi:hypothetical protein